MSSEKVVENANWEKARRQAVRSGIILTKRKDSQGNYVCYFNKKTGALLSSL